MFSIFSSLIFLCFVTTSANAQDSSEFAFDLYQKISKTEGNIFFSPFSLSSTLTMTAAGAKGQTFRQLEKMLHLSKNPHDFYLGLMPKLKSQDYDLLIANRMWGKNSGNYSLDFTKRLQDNYSSDLAPLDFAASPESSRLEINKWVEEKTNTKIKDLLPPNIITTQTELVITNAIYFKGLWSDSFEPQMTKTMEFDGATGKTSIPFLNRTSSYYFAKNKNAKMILIPYKGLDLGMVLILPAKKADLIKIEEDLSPKYFNSLFASGEPKTVNLALPKFKIEFNLNLNDTIKSLGVIDAFDAKKANFDGIRKTKSNKDKLFISQVIHKALIEVDEKGTEAASATAVAMATLGATREEKPEEFFADRPFIYLIRHQQTGAILFMGRFSAPIAPPRNAEQK